MKKSAFLFLLLFSWFSVAWADIEIVAAENFYGDVAEQLGKPYVHVVSIMNNPSQDPHLFSASPKTAVLLQHADIVIENGVGYDTWMDQLYTANPTQAFLINVGKCVHKISGTNPHIWYDPETMPVFAQIFVMQLIQQDPEHHVIFQKNLKNFLQMTSAYQKKISEVRKKVLGMKVTATEPVAGYLLDALGLDVLNQKFQQDVMNETDLTPHEIIQFEESLKASNNGTRLFVFNVQVDSPMTEQLRNLAIANHIPVVGVTETMPEHEHYYSWMNETLDALAKALT